MVMMRKQPGGLLMTERGIKKGDHIVKQTCSNCGKEYKPTTTREKQICPHCNRPVSPAGGSIEAICGIGCLDELPDKGY